MKILLNNQIYDSSSTQVNISEAGIQYGFGLFETLKLTNGVPEDLGMHLNRLQTSMNHFNLSVDNLRQKVNEGINKICVANDVFDGILKISVLKGNQENHLLFTMRPNTYSKDRYEKGFKLGLSKIKRNPYSDLVYHKTCNYMECVYERQKVIERGYDEVLFINIHDELAEGAVSNLFWVKDNNLYTPSLSTGILNGITRGKIIDYAEKNGIKVHQGSYKLKELENADACFITNSIMGIMPVSEIENTWYSKDNRIIQEIIRKLKNSLK